MRHIPLPLAYLDEAAKLSRSSSKRTISFYFNNNHFAVQDQRGATARACKARPKATFILGVYPRGHELCRFAYSTPPYMVGASAMSNLTMIGTLIEEADHACDCIGGMPNNHAA
jgi:hypothetical protein